jgi:hypothetical protein
MRHAIAAGLLTLLPLYGSAQTQTPAPVRAQRIPTTLKKVDADVMCPTPLGVGVTTAEAFCEVVTGLEPADGIIINVPPHEGTARLTFDLHNRHTYSAEEVEEHIAYRRYTATIGLLTLDNTLLGRAVVQSEFRSVADLLDRVSAGIYGLKAIAVVGKEPIVFTIPEREEQVSVLGEKLTVEGVDGSSTYTQPGRAIADIGHIVIEYRPARASRRSKSTPGATATTGTKAR